MNYLFLINLYSTFADKGKEDKDSIGHTRTLNKNTCKGMYDIMSRRLLRYKYDFTVNCTVHSMVST